MRRVRRPAAALAVGLAVALALAGAPAGAQPLAPRGGVWLDADGNVLTSRQVREMIPRGEKPACAITVPAGQGLDTTDEAALAQASEDVVKVADALKAALTASPDMRRKVLEACRKNGGDDDASPWPSIPIHVYRDHPQVDYATANPAGGGRTGNIVLDLGDIEQVPNFFQEGSDPELVAVISKSSLTRALAHEFDHLRDGPARGEWGSTHGDPLRHRDVMGAPVEDANQVKKEFGSGDVRTAYGADLIPFTGGEKLPGQIAVLRYTDLVNRNRTATTGGGSGFGSPGSIEGVPDHPCTAGGGRCFEPTTGDRDLDGVPDVRDNCVDTANPWQLDADGSGKGDDCEPATGGRDAGLRIGPSLNPFVLGGASLATGIQTMTIEIVPSTRRSDRPRSRGPAPGGGAPGRAEPRVFVTSAGGSTGEVFQVVVDADGADLEPGFVVVEPVELTVEERRRFESERDRAAGRGGVLESAPGYCLDLRLDPPAEGRVFRIVDGTPAHAEAFRILDAGRRVRDRGGLEADTSPESYFHAIRQWAVWVRAEGLDAEGFESAWIDQVRDAYDAAGQAWTETTEEALRDLAPGRWRDVRAVLAEAGL